MKIPALDKDLVYAFLIRLAIFNSLEHMKLESLDIIPFLRR